jgi:hypothetical protein
MLDVPHLPTPRQSPRVTSGGSLLVSTLQRFSRASKTISGSSASARPTPKICTTSSTSVTSAGRFSSNDLESRSIRMAGALRGGPAGVRRPRSPDPRRPLRRDHWSEHPRRAHQEAADSPPRSWRQRRGTEITCMGEVRSRRHTGPIWATLSGSPWATVDTVRKEAHGPEGLPAIRPDKPGANRRYPQGAQGRGDPARSGDPSDGRPTRRAAWAVVKLTTRGACG